MAYSIVQHTTGTNFSTSLAVAYSSNVTAGNLLLAFVSNNKSGQTNSVSDSLNGSWTQATADNSNVSISIFYFANTFGGACTVTATLPTSTSSGLLLVEVSGVKTSAPLDVAGASHGNSSTPATSITTTVNGDFIFGCIFMGFGSASVGTGFTQIDNIASSVLIDEWQTQSNAGVESVAFNSSASAAWQVLGAAFKPAAGAVPTDPPYNNVFQPTFINFNTIVSV